ncbi:BglG family transcription antiterminator [Gracilibacillus sp. YIM 98692]|uniref:BglG family transcription antiterminator n=1 Tax=Gracilibacillus sp. YIM 98692 TaxID=2663532 RepID=UPI0013D1C6A5|nr:BglG family transcription antiterminator [Gracilibacillus sp. YIM 98692]
MQLDERSTLLLKELLLFPRVKVNHLCKKFQLSRSQVNYSIEKIKDWLSHHHYPTMQMDRQLGITLDPAVREKFPELMMESTVSEYVLSAEERTYFILILLLSRQEIISLFHISDQLKVSRNTVIKDLKKLDDITHAYHLELAYTRRKGYFLKGEEFDKRKLLIELVPKLLNITNGFQQLLSLTNITNEEVHHIREKCETIEEVLNARFTDEKLDELPFIFLLLYRRMEYGKYIRFYHPNREELVQTKEYQAIEHLFSEDLAIHDPNEKQFIALQLLSSSVFSSSAIKPNDDRLREAIHQMLATFEKLACLSFTGYQELMEKIYQHMKPASYRMKYNIPLKNPLLSEIKKEHASTHRLVKQSVTPLEHVLNTKMSEDEIGFITILITAWLQKHGKQVSESLKAIVICPNGVSVSKLLLETLKDLFPHIAFIENMSVRDFNQYEQHYDVIFSTVFLQTTKKQFLVKPYISEMEKQRLKERVNQELYGFDHQHIDFSALLQLIQKHATIDNQQELLHDLKQYFFPTMKRPHQPKVHTTSPDLNELLTENRLLIRSSVRNFAEAVQVAAEPLLGEKVIEKRYVSAILNQLEEHGPYMLLGPGIAIPHASPEDGVKETAMSLLRLDHPVEIAPGFPIDICIMLAAEDRQKHLKALAQLNDFLASEENVRKWKKTCEVNQIRDLIDAISAADIGGVGI